jgi:heavy metal translocating P-type ATPase
MGACCSAKSPDLIHDGPEDPPHTTPWLRLAIGLAISGLTMTFSLGVNLSPPSDTERYILHGLLAVAVANVFILLGGPVLSRSMEQIRQGRPGMDVLFLLGIGGAFAASLHSTLSHTGDVYYEVVAILLCIHTIGSALGDYQRHKASMALNHLRLDFSSARTFSGDRVDTSSIRPHDRVRVFPGEAITIDGTILDGRATVTETALTGEPYAVVRNPGDQVLAGSRCHDGTLLIEASVSGRARQLDSIIGQLEFARLQRSRLQSQADRLSRIFLPLVTLASATTFTGWYLVGPWQDALFHALAVIVVACPCALGLATPLALWGTLNQLRLHGITVRSIDWIEKLAQCDTVLFDKTGTLTEPEPVLVDWHLLDDRQRVQIQQSVAALEASSDHPLASLFRGWTAGPAPESTTLIPGQGISGIFKDGSSVEIGNESLLEAEDCARLNSLESRIQDSGIPSHRLFIRYNGQLAGIACYRESLRSTGAELIDAFRRAGFDPAILTGDRQSNAHHWEKSLSVPIHFGLTPDQKVAHLESLAQAGKRTLYVGDGINDSPAFTVAHASVAIEDGSPLAQETADASLPGQRMDCLLTAIHICRHTIKTVRGNLKFAAGYNAIGIALAASGILNPVHAALLMLASSATVTYRAWKMAESEHLADGPAISASESSHPAPHSDTGKKLALHSI